MHTHDFRRQKINWLPEHASFRFDSAHAPADHAETIDHGGVGIGADERIGIVDAILLQHALGEVFEIHLVHDADARGHDAESLKGLLAPLEELVTLAIALEFEIKI